MPATASELNEAMKQMTVGLDLGTEPVMREPTVTELGSSSRARSERIGGRNILEVYENAEKFVDKASDPEAKRKMVDQANEQARKLEADSKIAIRIHEAEEAGNRTLADQLRQAIMYPTLRAGLPPSIKGTVMQELSEHDKGLGEIMAMKTKVEGMGISNPTIAEIDSFENFLYDQSRGERVDMVTRFRQLKQKAATGFGREKTDAEAALNDIKEGTTTPQLLRLCFQMQDGLTTNGETFQGYLDLRRKAQEAEKTGRKLAGKELRDWEAARDVVNHVFSGNEDELAIITGDFEGKEYKRNDGTVLTNADRTVLGAVRTMVNMMAEAYDGKGLGRGVERVSTVFPEGTPDVVQEVRPALRGEADLPTVTRAEWEEWVAKGRAAGVKNNLSEAQIVQRIQDQQAKIRIVE